MTKELEALEIIKNITLCKEQDPKTGLIKVHFASEIYKKQIDIIETALKELIDIKSGKIRLSVNSGENYVAVPKYQYEQDLKKLKSLDVIKKIVKYDIEVNGNNFIPEYYPNDVFTQEEYDLLKGVLL